MQRRNYEGPKATFYDITVTVPKGDVGFYVQEAQKAGSPVLELACGTGRVLISIADAGIKIVGLDYGPDMLAVARQKVAQLSIEKQGNIQLTKGDMREFSFSQRFNLVIIAYYSFMELLTPEDQRKALDCVHRHLTDDGLLLLHLSKPDLVELAKDSGSSVATMRKTGEFIRPDTGNKVVIWGGRRCYQASQISEWYDIYEELDNQGMVISRHYYQMKTRHTFRYEMQYLLELCGYRIEALYGNFQREPFGKGNEQIWAARKA